jgi:ribosomal RNA assembly protein
MRMPIEEVSIPDERKPILIGKDGKTKGNIEKKTGTTIQMADFVKISGPIEGLLKARNIVQAIARGFSPENAFALLDEQYQIDIITLNQEKENTRKRLFARIIGRKGESKKIIEKETNTMISVYGKTVAIIGLPEGIDAARKAIETLLEGKTHAYAYSLMKNE